MPVPEGGAGTVRDQETDSMATRLPLASNVDIDLMDLMGSIAHKLLGEVECVELDQEGRRAALLERALMYAAEAERQERRSEEAER